MSDGWSDKSVSPAVYTPAAANTPQLEIDEVVLAATYNSATPFASIGTKITPAPQLLFETAEITPNGDTANGTIMVATSLENDAGDIFSLWNNGATVKVLKIDKASLTWAQVGSNITAPMTFSTQVFLFRNFGGGRLVIVGSSGRVAAIQSTDHGATWANVWDTGAVTGLAGRQISEADANGTYFVFGYRTIGGVAQPVAVKVTGWGTGVSVVDMPSVTGMTAAAFYGAGCVKVGATTWLGCAQPASGNAYVFRTTDGTTWTHIHTTSGTTIISTASYGQGRYLGNGACAFFHAYGTSNGKVLVCESAGNTINLRATPNNVFMVPPGHRHNQSLSSGLLADGACYAVGYTASNAYFGFYASADYCANWTKVSSQAVSLAMGLVVSEVTSCLFLLFSSVVGSDATAVNYSTKLVFCNLGVERFVTMPTTAAFTATSPAKLSSLGAVTPQLITASKQGTVKLYLQHYNDEIGAWSSLGDVADAWSDCGTLTDNTPFSLPAHTCRAGEQFRFKIGFTPTDPTGIQAAPELESLSFVWSSDVTAPDSPSITRIISTTISGQAGYRVDFGALPDGARHIILEGQINSGGYSPFNNKAAFASGTHMRFRGSRDAIEEAGERNELNAGFLNGLTEGDIVQVKIAAEDDVGNRSAFVESDPITLAAPAVPPVIVSFYASPDTMDITESATISWEVTGSTYTTINGNAVDASGSLVVNPTETTVYVLEAEAGAFFLTDAITVTVTKTAPAVNSFTATPGNIFEGGTALLEWTIQAYATNSVEIFEDGSSIAVITNGAANSLEVSPTATASYLLRLSDNGGSAEAACAVTVGTTGGATLPTISSFTATPAEIDTGDTVTLEWLIADAVSAVISPGSIDANPITGTTEVTPAATTMYTITATNADGTTEKSVLVSVPAYIGEPVDAIKITVSQKDEIEIEVNA